MAVPMRATTPAWRGHRRAPRTQKSPDVPTDVQDAQYELDHIHEIAKGLSSTTLLDDAALFVANDPDRPLPVLPGTLLVDRPAEHIITGMPWSDMAPVDHANLAELEFPCAGFGIADVPALTTEYIASRKFSAQILTSERTQLETVDEWLQCCANAPDGEHGETLHRTALSHVNKHIGTYRPAEDAAARVEVYYCWIDIFVFIVLSDGNNMQKWQFYALRALEK